MLGHPPKTWDSTLLDHLTVFVLGGDWGKNADYDDPDYVSVLCIRASELRNWKTEHGSSAALRKIKKSSLASRELREGDIVVEVSGGGPDQPVGRTALINSTVLAKNPGYPKICTNFFRLLRPAREMNSDFLNLYLKFFYKTGKIAAFQGGSNNLRNLKFNDYLTIRVPIPPAAEQHRIVAKIEELFSELDKGVESLKAARAKLKVYRQSVLKHAFEGKLTAQWRKENKDKLENPDQLLARIKQERKARYKQQVQRWKAAVKKWEEGGKSGKRPTKPKKLRSFSDFAQNQPLTDTWPIYELGDLISVSSGQSLTSKAMRGGRYPVYGGNGITGYHDEYLFSEPTLIIGRVGAKCGVTHITSANSWITDNALITSPLLRSFDQRYFKFLLEQKNLNILGSSTGQPVISGAKIYPVHIPLPTLAEQMVIADKIERVDSSIDELTTEIDNQQLKANALRQSILKTAFNGQLVAQDPRDEPASVLLDRIKAEKTARSQKYTRAKRRRTAATT